MAGAIVKEQQMNTAADLPATAHTCPADNEPFGDTAEGDKKMNNQERKRKTKEIIMPQREVDYALSFEPVPYEPELLASLEAMGLGLDPDLVAFREEQDRWMLTVQEDYKQQIADKGYVSCTVEVNEEDGEEDSDYDDDYDDDDYEDDDEEDQADVHIT